MGKDKWYVETLKCVGEREFYTAAKRLGEDIVTRGGYWETEAEAQKLADKLNEGESDECLQ